jgi:hypothetical protein
MLRLLTHFIEQAQRAQEAGSTPEAIFALDIVRPLQRMGEEIGDDALDRFAALAQRIDAAFEALAATAPPAAPPPPPLETMNVPLRQRPVAPPCTCLGGAGAYRRILRRARLGCSDRTALTPPRRAPAPAGGPN